MKPQNGRMKNVASKKGLKIWNHHPSQIAKKLKITQIERESHLPSTSVFGLNVENTVDGSEILHQWR